MIWIILAVYLISLCISIGVVYSIKRKTRKQFSKMIHDMRTPINSILGIIDLSCKHTKEPIYIDQSLGQMKVNAQYLLGLTSDLFKITKMKQNSLLLEKKEFDLIEFLDSTCDMVQPLMASKNLTFETDFKIYHRIIMGDELHFREIIINLLSNAMKYTPFGKSISFYAMEHKNGYTFQIKDTGIGMKKDFLKSIFKPYSQELSNSNGMGLGMSIVKHLTSCMKGKINVTSELGKGSIFELFIPFQKIESKKHTILEKEPTLTSLQDMHLLLVEDNDTNVVLMKSILEEAHIDVHIARNGKEGLEDFRQSKIGYYDVILMDVQMPILDGLKATKEIRNLKRTDAKIVDIVAMTANSCEQDYKEAKRAGMNYYLAKPVDMKSLYELLIECRDKNLVLSR